MTSKKYTAQELREVAENITRVDVMDGLTCREHCYPVKQEVKSMLRYAADVVERCEKMILPCDFDGEPCVPSDAGNCPSCDSPTHNTPFNCILRGDAGKEEK